MKHLSILSILLLFGAQGAFAGDSPQKLRWFFAHGPSDPLVQNLVKTYAERITKKSGHRLEIQPETFPETQWQNPRGWVTRWHDAFNKVMTGEVDIVQLSAEELAVRDGLFDVFDLPFLFSGPRALEKTLNGEVGRSLLARVGRATDGKLRAFAFTYSGGFRVVASLRELKTADDFRSLKIIKEMPHGSGDAMRAETFKLFGSTLVDTMVMPGFYGEGEGKVNSVQAPYKDIQVYRDLAGMKPAYVSDDHLNVFVTVILMNEATFQKLSGKDKELVTSELTKLAREERKLFTDSAKELKKTLPSQGIKITSLSRGEKGKLRALAEPIYQRFSAQEGAASMLEKIKGLK